MIAYHGGPITPYTAALAAWKGRHGLVSHYNPEQTEFAFDVCQTVMQDNGAFSLWRAGKLGASWEAYYAWVAEWMRHPKHAGAIIPDVIEGSEDANDALLAEWPHGPYVGIPVWHLNESIGRLVRLAARFPRVALGSCGEYDVQNPRKCVTRLREVLPAICDERGFPLIKLHGLRMLSKDIRAAIPLASADASTVARNIGLDCHWRGFAPKSKTARAVILVDQIESVKTAACLDLRKTPAVQGRLL